MFDIDRFKQFNDTYGHQAGDKCLRVVPACFRDHSRSPSDIACRYGGENSQSPWGQVDRTLPL